MQRRASGPTVPARSTDGYRLNYRLVWVFTVDHRLRRLAVLAARAHPGRAPASWRRLRSQLDAPAQFYLRSAICTSFELGSRDHTLGSFDRRTTQHRAIVRWTRHETRCRRDGEFFGPPALLPLCGAKARFRSGSKRTQTPGSLPFFKFCTNFTFDD